MNTIKKVAMGESHCVFLMADGSLWGIGTNEYGQLGLPFDPKNPEPINQIT